MIRKEEVEVSFVSMFCTIATVVKEHSSNTQPEQRHTVPEAVNAVKVEGS
jgi:hypothetical protein